MANKQSSSDDECEYEDIEDNVFISSKCKQHINNSSVVKVAQLNSRILPSVKRVYSAKQKRNKTPKQNETQTVVPLDNNKPVVKPFIEKETVDCWEELM
jgi:hypothetical protein